MQAYHSHIREYNSSVGNMAILPLRTNGRGPAPIVPSLEQDVIDESLYYFKANVFFRTYEIKVNHAAAVNDWSIVTGLFVNRS